ncbi:MAG TPA: exonuclease domain-containing protein [Ktedonobacterales bacterium]|nr:exonuclease domain-containing protein [Ktedonobacterales bacterium]
MRPQPVRVAIDLETTGLHPEQDTVIEIGALKFAGEQVIETFESFVGGDTTAIPYRVRRLTGITPAQVRHAPPMSDLAPRLRAFLGDLPLVGHSVPFDVAFLRKAGLARHNPLVDTYELATTLLPNLASYTLGAVGTTLGVSSPTYHRALADAQLSRDVFLALLARLEDLDAGTLEALGRLTAPPDWTPAFFVRAELRARAAAQPRPTGRGAVGGTLGDQLAAKLGMDPSVLALAVAPGVTPAAKRPAAAASEPPPDVAIPAELDAPASALAHSVSACFDEGGALLAEIENDPASRDACLVAALHWAEQHEQRVLICVANRDAMNQMVSVGLPRAFALAGVAPERLPVADVDESAAYLCLHRWYGAARESRDSVFSRDLARGLAKLTVWAGQTQTGRRAEVTMGGPDGVAWERARGGEEYQDSFASCAYRRDGYCFVTKAREGAENARVVVTTHAALASQLAGNESLLPVAGRVLVMDAHLLEDELRRVGETTLDRQEILALLDTLATMESGNRRAGLLHIAATRANAGSGDIERERAWFAQVQRTRASVESFFQALQLVMQAAAGQRDEDAQPGESFEQRTLRVDDRTRQLSAWQTAASAYTTFEGHCAALAKLAREAGRAGQGGRERKGGLAADGIATDLFGVARALERQCQRGAAFFHPQGEQNAVRWLRVPYAPGASAPPNGPWQRRDRRGEKPDAREPAAKTETGAGAPTTEQTTPRQEAAERSELPIAQSAPLRVGNLIEPLWQPDRALVLTGPALAVSGDYAYLRGTLGLPDDTRTLNPARERARQTLLCLPDDVPEPNVSQYQRRLDDALVALATALNGRLVAIFPSHAALRSSAQGIRRILEQRDILVLAQGQDGSVRQLWQTFRNEERVVLLGAGAFWDGSEQPERPPACVVVTRVPFPAMSDPLLAARAEQWRDQQNEFVVPHAALRVHQALSGLAWSHQRRNAIVLFDRRLQTRGYGPTILETLPHCTQEQDTMARLTERIAEWVE